ncbi:hypothetical protein CKAN_02276100 [Cinnamomum micranthum f. kanehirae]|uniref:Uncharacterized protein n=1 Tax=Cinnamomum micranthum f. kanehirae TaxID=337451 RepID=A0A3S3R2R5_9MAGN|nr:hypothetical protein CKAN_02276100 [Cinnamomum micranthum f. kanehirae]
MRQFMALLVLVVLVMGLWEATPAGAARSVSCAKERRNLVNACKSMVFGKLPNADCCLLLRLVRFRYHNPLTNATTKNIEMCPKTNKHDIKL